jgi:hypothetical protein
VASDAKADFVVERRDWSNDMEQHHLNLVSKARGEYRP